MVPVQAMCSHEGEQMPLSSVQLELEPSALDLRYVPACAHACMHCKQAGRARPGPEQLVSAAACAVCCGMPISSAAHCTAP